MDFYRERREFGIMSGDGGTVENLPKLSSNISELTELSAELGQSGISEKDCFREITLF